ncbi:MAG: class I SAM-dependent methyltransferase [Infirmifilum sp.]
MIRKSNIDPRGKSLQVLRRANLAARVRALASLFLLNLFSRFIGSQFEFKEVRVEVPKGCFPPIFLSTGLAYDVAVHFVRGKLGCEIGVGTGALALALCKKLDVEIVGTDIDFKCIHAASRNAYRNRLDHLFHPVVCPEAKCLRKDVFDFVVSNPPYFPLNPRGTYGESACGGLGLEVLEEMLRDAVRILRSNGILIFSTSSLTGELRGTIVVAERWALLDKVRIHLYFK